MIYDLLTFYALTIPTTYILATYQYTNIIFIPLIINTINNYKFEYNIMEIFNVVKFISILLSIYFNNQLLLIINIFEACIMDIIIVPYYGIPNSIVGLYLIYYYENSINWIINYTLWNAIFVYGVDFSKSVLLILLVPFIDINNWFKLRAYSLLINQIFRGCEICWIYTPGKSFITKEKDKVMTNQYIRMILGLLLLLKIYI